MSNGAAPAGRGGRVAGILSAVGGALMAIGVFLPFARFDAGGLPGGVSETATALDTPDGKLFLIAGIILLVLGILIAVLGSTVTIRILAVVGLLVSGLMLYAAIVDLTGLESAFAASVAQETGLPVGQVEATIEQFGAGVSGGIGLYLVLAGSGVAVIGSIMGLFARGRAGAAPIPEAAPPPPAT